MNANELLVGSMEALTIEIRLLREELQQGRQKASVRAPEPDPAPQRAKHDPGDEAARDNPGDPPCQWPDCPRRVPAAQERLSREHFGKTLCVNHESQLAVVRSKKRAAAAKGVDHVP